MPLCTSEKIAELRKTKGMSQQTLADVLFVSRSLVAMWEAGARVPDSVSVSPVVRFLTTIELQALSTSMVSVKPASESDELLM